MGPVVSLPYIETTLYGNRDYSFCTMQSNFGLLPVQVLCMEKITVHIKKISNWPSIIPVACFTIAVVYYITTALNGFYHLPAVHIYNVRQKNSDNINYNLHSSITEHFHTLLQCITLQWSSQSCSTRRPTDNHMLSHDMRRNSMRCDLDSGSNEEKTCIKVAPSTLMGGWQAGRSSNL